CRRDFLPLVIQQKAINNDLYPILLCCFCCERASNYGSIIPGVQAYHVKEARNRHCRVAPSAPRDVKGGQTVWKDQIHGPERNRTLFSRTHHTGLYRKLLFILLPENTCQALTGYLLDRFAGDLAFTTEKSNLDTKSDYEAALKSILNHVHFDKLKGSVDQIRSSFNENERTLIYTIIDAWRIGLEHPQAGTYI
ncbi:uncharacterized protein LDX57_007876, partial [Aspergillus melleus]|uniref:uncharacterized protein n=1 Tax=Aspergillus melleus TaxID=138277 RepID=UPI001E8CF285